MLIIHSAMPFLLQAASGSASGLEAFTQFLFPLAIGLVLYFFMIRPQQKKASDAKRFRESLVKGARVVTIGGLHGQIVEISDSTVLLRFFESNGRLRRAITVIKSRSAAHALTIQELQLGAEGIRIGAPLEGFDGVLSGLPSYRGQTPMMSDLPIDGDA